MVNLLLIFIYTTHTYTQIFSASELMLKSNLNIKSICKKINLKKTKVVYHENIKSKVKKKKYTINITSFEERLIKHSLFTSHKLNKAYVDILYSDIEDGSIIADEIKVQFEDQSTQDNRTVGYRGPIWFLQLKGKSLNTSDWQHIVDLFFKDLYAVLPASTHFKLSQAQKIYKNIYNGMRVKIDGDTKKAYLQKGEKNNPDSIHKSHYIGNLNKHNKVWYYDSNDAQWKQHTLTTPLDILRNELIGDYDKAQVSQLHQNFNTGKLQILLSSEDREYYKNITSTEQPLQIVNEDWNERPNIVSWQQYLGLCSGCITEKGNMFGFQMYFANRRNDMYLAKKFHSYTISLNSVYPDLYFGIFAGKDFPAIQVYSHFGCELHTLKMQYMTNNFKIEFPHKTHLCYVLGLGCCFKLSNCVKLFTDILYAKSMRSLEQNISCCDSKQNVNIDHMSFDKLTSVIGLKYELP